MPRRRSGSLQNRCLVSLCIVNWPWVNASAVSFGNLLRIAARHSGDLRLLASLGNLCFRVAACDACVLSIFVGGKDMQKRFDAFLEQVG